MFLSNLAYLSKDITQRELDYYFGEGVTVDKIDVKENTIENKTWQSFRFNVHNFLSNLLHIFLADFSIVVDIQ